MNSELLKHLSLLRRLTCPDFLKSESVFSLLAATSSLGVDDLIGLLAEIPGDLARGSLGSRPKLCESFLSDLLNKCMGQHFELQDGRSSLTC